MDKALYTHLYQHSQDHKNTFGVYEVCKSADEPLWSFNVQSFSKTRMDACVYVCGYSTPTHTYLILC